MVDGKKFIVRELGKNDIEFEHFSDIEKYLKELCERENYSLGDLVSLVTIIFPHERR